MAINPTQLTPKTKSKFNSLIIMAAIAVILGLIAAGGIWQYLSQTQKQVKELTATRPVVVAGKQIPAGTKLTAEFLAIKQLPTQTIPKDYPSSIESVKNRIVKTTLQADEIVTEARLVGQGGGGLAVVIPPGYRAITIKVNEVIGIGGFISPGHHVDIVSVFEKSDKEKFSKTILQNVLVLAVGDKVFDPNSVSEPQAKIVSQVTVALNPRDAEKLTLAADKGHLQLVLRPHGELGESTPSGTEGVSLEDVYGYIAYYPEEQTNTNIQSSIPVPVSTRPEMNSIEIILGNERSYFYY